MSLFVHLSSSRLICCDAWCYYVSFQFDIFSAAPPPTSVAASTNPFTSSSLRLQSFFYPFRLFQEDFHVFIFLSDSHHPGNSLKSSFLLWPFSPSCSLSLFCPLIPPLGYLVWATSGRRTLLCACVSGWVSGWVGDQVCGLCCAGFWMEQLLADNK